MDSGEGPEPVGFKRAAVRKIGHELGTKAGALHLERFKCMGRMHYCAADTVIWGPETPWVSHEIDYLLLYQMRPSERLELVPP